MLRAPSWIEMPDVRLRMMAFTLEVLGPVLRLALNFMQRTGSPAGKPPNSTSSFRHFARENSRWR